MRSENNEEFGKLWEESRLLISASGYVTTDEKWKLKPVPFPFSRLYFVADGSGVLVTDGQQMVLEPGYVYLAPSGIPCGFYGTDSVTKLFFHMNVTMPDGCDLFENCKEFQRIPISVKEIYKLKEWYLSQDAVKQTMLKCSIWRVISEFSEICYTGKRESVYYSPATKRAIVYIRENIKASLTVNEIADALYISRSALTTKFRKEFGVTIAQHIENLVMQRAQWLLLDSDFSVSRISEELGFCDQFYFSRRFSHRFHISPSDYRKNANKAKY